MSRSGEICTYMYNIYNMYKYVHIDLKRSATEFDLGSRSREVLWPRKSYCISVDASVRDDPRKRSMGENCIRVIESSLM